MSAETGRRPHVIIDLMSHIRSFGHEVVGNHARYAGVDAPHVIGVDAFDTLDDVLPGAATIQISGSAAMLKENAPWAPRLAQAIEDAARERVPVLGICFGHQLMADHFGGTLESWDKSKVGIATTRFDRDTGPFSEGSMDILYTHRDRITELSAELEQVGSGGFGGIAAIKHRSLPIWSVQGHPEADARLTRIAEKKDVEMYDDATLDTPDAKQILRRFTDLAC